MQQCNANDQHATTVQTYSIATGTVCTNSAQSAQHRVHAGYMFCGTLVDNCICLCAYWLDSISNDRVTQVLHLLLQKLALEGLDLTLCSTCSIRH